MTKSDHLRETVEHLDIRTIDAAPLLDGMARMSYSARDLSRAARILVRMIRDPDCTILLCLAGSLVSGGLRRVILDLVRHGMVDGIVSTGANIVDQDFFEGLGFRHYLGDPRADDRELQRLRISRIYDTYIDEDQLCACDDTIRALADSLEPRAYSSREFIREMGRHLREHSPDQGSIVQECYEQGVPIFVPAFSDCSAGFGLIEHQHTRPERHVTIDPVKDFLELARVKAAAPATGLFMIGGGVPKNFAQDVAVGTEFLGVPPKPHRYSVQVTVADARDGGLSGSTLREAHSWGKVAIEEEQMVFCEATIALPLLAAYAWQSHAWKGRAPRAWGGFLDR